MVAADYINFQLPPGMDLPGAVNCRGIKSDRIKTIVQAFDSHLPRLPLLDEGISRMLEAYPPHCAVNRSMDDEKAFTKQLFCSINEKEWDKYLEMEMEMEVAERDDDEDTNMDNNRSVIVDTHTGFILSVDKSNSQITEVSSLS